MFFPHLLVFVLSTFHLASAFWPFSESSDEENDLKDVSSDDSGYYNRCLDIYKCDKCFKIKKEGKCHQHLRECRKTCSGCEGPGSDRFGAEKCQYFKKKGYCDYPSFKYFKCQKTCSICEVDGNWGKWSEWSTCTKTCKQGKQSRTRECNSPAPRYGGKACVGKRGETRVCNDNVPCPVDGNWGKWSEWSACTKTCKQGKQSRTRKCDAPSSQYGGKPCVGKPKEERICNAKVPCPVDGNWGQWSAWNTCSKTCAQGTQSRTRKCDSPIPRYGGKLCQGKSSQAQVCNKDIPCPVDGNWGAWGGWSTCTKTCKQGKQSRTRECNYPAPLYGGRKCDGEAEETQVCNHNVPCPVDGNWGAWGGWSTCTKTCKQGKQSRTRECNYPAPLYGGKKCDGEAEETQVCNHNVPCPVDGNWGAWGGWSTCTKTCKQGKQSRTRECNSPAPLHGGKKCDGEAKETQACNHNVPCPVDGNWGAWGGWSTCTKTCKQGKQSRTRKCNSPVPLHGGKKCDGEAKETQVCNHNVPCPVDGNWGAWGGWSTCTKTCKQGKQSRTRECNSPAPLHGGKKCDGKAEETQVCNHNVPCPVDGNWGAWGGWSMCTKTCKQGKQSRTRECNSPAPLHGGKKCDGKAEETQVCNHNVPCPVDGNWGAWGGWSMCTKTCKQGKQSRTRECDTPAPLHGGKKCDGEGKETQMCNEMVPCPVDGNWGQWSEWSTCTKSCKQGKQSRTRECNSPAPRYGGKKCEGEPKDSRVCNAKVPCPVDGHYGPWSKWSACSKTCKEGQQSRTRECNSPAPQHGGMNCTGDSNENQVCNGHISCPVNGNWGEWSEWSKCSKTCGGGEHSRRRKCDNPAPAHGGKDCEGAFKQRQLCNKDKCPVDGGYGPWSTWSICSKTCKEGKQSRTRECNSPVPQYGGKHCQGKPSETVTCNENVPCPIDGMWGSWSAWTACSKTCGYGTRERTRYCDNPKPAYDGKLCVGIGFQKRRCHAYYPCPIDGNWTSWGAWTQCTKTCGLSYRKRSRSCTDPAPQYGGSGCEGQNDQVERCTGKPCY